MRGILSPQNTPKTEQAVENKSSIEGTEVEGAMHAPWTQECQECNYP